MITKRSFSIAGLIATFLLLVVVVMTVVFGGQTQPTVVVATPEPTVVLPPATSTPSPTPTETPESLEPARLVFVEKREPGEFSYGRVDNPVPYLFSLEAEGFSIKSLTPKEIIAHAQVPFGVDRTREEPFLLVVYVPTRVPKATFEISFRMPDGRVATAMLEHEGIELVSEVIPTPTPSSTLTPSPTPTPTPRPTQTPVPRPTSVATPTPSSRLSPDQGEVPLQYGCGGAVFIIDDYRMPSHITDSWDQITVWMRYSFPVGSEIQMGNVAIETSVGRIPSSTVRRFVPDSYLGRIGLLSTNLVGSFAAPSTSQGVQGIGIVDGEEHPVILRIRVFPEALYDKGAPHHSSVPGWAYSMVAETPFRLMEPLIFIVRFTLDGVEYSIDTYVDDGCVSTPIAAK